MTGVLSVSHPVSRGFNSRSKSAALAMAVFEDEIFSNQTCDIAGDVIVVSQGCGFIEAHICGARDVASRK